MSPESLDEFKALSPGCEVWIVPGPSVSKWTRKIDWYLGFQIMKASVHEPLEISPELKSILEREEIASIPMPSRGSSSPLMIASGSRLPAKTTVMIPFKGDLSAWAEKCHRIWKDLTCPRLRVFLPDSITPKSFISVWPSESRDSARVEVVPESNMASA